MESRRKLLFWIIGLLILCVLILFLSLPVMSADRITITPEKFDSEAEPYDLVGVIYEISETSLVKGFETDLNEKDAFRLSVGGSNYYIILWDVEDSAEVLFPFDRVVSFNEGDTLLVDVNQNGILDIELVLKGFEKGVSGKFFIKRFVEEELIPEGDYFELFDVTVILDKKELGSSRDLEAFVMFENFGEGFSEIDIVYSIVDSDDNLVYGGVDSKVVQTEETVVKSFDFLDLPFGDYVLRTEIFYGDNQTGLSEQEFSVVERSFFDLVKAPLFFVLIVVVIFVSVKLIGKLKNSD